MIFLQIVLILHESMKHVQIDAKVWALFKSRDSHIDYAFSLDWVSQAAHTISYAFNF